MSNWKILQIMPASGWEFGYVNKKGQEGTDKIVGWALVTNEENQTEVKALVAVDGKEKSSVVLIDEAGAQSWRFISPMGRA